MTLGNVQDIVLVLSGKGGVGKSSTTTQLALSLCLLGKTVGILDVDLTGPSMARFLNVENEKITQAPGGWLPVKVHETQNLPSHTDTSPPRPVKPANETSAVPAVAVPFAVTHPEQKVGALYAMSLAFLLSSRDMAVVWRGPKKTAMIRQFISDVLWPELDYLLVDTPPGTSDEHISLVESLLKAVVPAFSQPTSNGDSTTPHLQPGPRLAGAVLVTTPQAISTADVRKELSFCHKTGVPVIGVIENMSGFVCPCCGEISNIFSKGGGQLMAADWNVPFLGSLAVDEKWGLLIEEGRRPTYDAETNNASENLDEDVEMDVEEVKVEVSEEDKRALLVDKYRSCSLRTVFSEIAKQVVDTVDRRAAVKVIPPASAMGR